MEIINESGGGCEDFVSSCAGLELAFSADASVGAGLEKIVSARSEFISSIEDASPFDADFQRFSFDVSGTASQRRPFRSFFQTNFKRNSAVV